MAQPLMPGVLLLAASVHAHAALLLGDDPTKPPAAMLAPVEKAATGAPAASLVLQSVILGPAHRIAIISGKTVHLGEQIGDARLVRLTETQAELATPQGKQILELLPAVQKHPSGAVLDTGLRGKKQGEHH